LANRLTTLEPPPSTPKTYFMVFSLHHPAQYEDRKPIENSAGRLAYSLNRLSPFQPSFTVP
jgi:hypothetical protein